METKAKWLLNLLHGFFNVLWFLNIVLCAIALFGLTIVFITNDYTGIDTIAKYKSPPTAFNLNASSTNANTITIRPNEALIKMNIKITPIVMFTSYALFILFEALIITILYNLRKILFTIKHRQPFQYENVSRLRIIASCLSLFTIYNALINLINYCLFATYVQNFHDQYKISYTSSFLGVILGAVVYIMADIFRYGFELKKENEEFI